MSDIKDRVKQKVDKVQRKSIVSMKKRGNPQWYIALYFNISEARVSQILKEEEVKKSRDKKQ